MECNLLFYSWKWMGRFFAACCFVALLVAFVVPTARAEESTDDRSFFGRVGDRLESIWDTGTVSLYLPAYAWHNRLLYDSKEARKFNEHPWGAGIGISKFHEDHDEELLYVMGFMDSNDHFQPIVGYAYIWNWEMFSEAYFGLGITAGLSARHEWNYIPFPAALPVVSLEYKNLAVQATYIPGPRNHSNVLFTWLRWNFD